MFSQNSNIAYLPPLRGRQFPPRVPERTDFSALTGRSALLLADFENLTYSARQRCRGREPDAGLLLVAIRHAARWATPMAFASVPLDTIDAARQYFEAAGWQPFLTPHQVIHDRNGARLLANSDASMLINAGAQIARSAAKAVVVLSGDGDLIDAIARYSTTLPKPREVFTCSVPGSTSARALACNNPLIAGNILIGADLLVLADTEPSRRTDRSMRWPLRPRV